MNKDKQIEEMVIALTEAQHEFDKAWHECLHNNGKQPERENVFYAKYLIENKNYRKASDVAREIFAEIEKIRAKELRRCEILRENESDLSERKYWEGGEHSLRQFTYWFNELKKKYTEDGE